MDHSPPTYPYPPPPPPTHAQSHPARDAHDTFFVKDPAATLTVPEDYYERVKAVHEQVG